MGWNGMGWRVCLKDELDSCLISSSGWEFGLLVNGFWLLWARWMYI